MALNRNAPAQELETKMLYIDNPNSGKHGMMSPEAAVLSGKIKTDSVDELRQFERAFPLDPRIIVEVSKSVMNRNNVTGAISPEEARKLLEPKEKTDIIFKEVFPKTYQPSNAPGWNSTLYFNIAGAGDYTVKVENGQVQVSDGKVGTPDGSLSTDASTFFAMMRFEALNDASQLKDVTVVYDEEASEELSDEQLELVAGGKGCGAEACGSEANAGTLCGADAGKNVAEVGSICGADAGSTSAGAGQISGAGACHGELNAGSICGADACFADICAGNLCGADAGIMAACAGNVCGADIAPGPDYGPCLANVVPGVPFI